MKDAVQAAGEMLIDIPPGLRRRNVRMRRAEKMTFEERRRMADLELWKMLSRTFPGLVRNVRFEHYDAGGWWYTSNL